MGLDVQEVTKIFDFTYLEKLENELTEHEFDHVFIGFSDDLPLPNADEVSDFRFVDVDLLRDEIKTNPQNYTVWFRKIIDRVVSEMNFR